MFFSQQQQKAVVGDPEMVENRYSMSQIIGDSTMALPAQWILLVWVVLFTVNVLKRVKITINRKNIFKK